MTEAHSNPAQWVARYMFLTTLVKSLLITLNLAWEVVGYLSQERSVSGVRN